MESVYDAKGNEIYFKTFNGMEVWKEYDTNGKLIHYKYKHGTSYYEVWKEYDTNCKLIHTIDSEGYEEWYTYNTDGTVTVTDSDGIAETAIASPYS
jgi:YD repeat-containing protein